jgi:prophage regulatory protein
MLYPLSTVVKEVTLSKSTIYRLIKAGQFPEPISLSPGRVAWQKSDIETFISSRPLANAQGVGR